MQRRRNSILGNSKLLIAYFVLLLLPFMVVSCAKKPEGPAGMAVPVTTAVLQQEKLENTTNYVATMFNRESTDIKPRVSGPIKNILVNDGAFVNQGAVIMTIEASEQAAATNSAQAKSESAAQDVKQAEASLKASAADVSAAISGLELARVQLDRYKKLYETNSATKSDLDTYTNNYNQAKAQLASSQENYKAQKQTVGSKKANYKETLEGTLQNKIVQNYYSIQAPFTGYVGTIPVKIGDYVDETTVLTTVTKSNGLEVQFAVDVKDKYRLKKGLTVRVSDSSNMKPVETKIWFIEPKVDSDSQTIMVKALLNNNNGRFQSDQVVDASIIWNTFDGIAVPTSAVSHFAGQDYVYLVQKDKKGQTIALQTPVDLGEIQNNKYIITDGVKAGDTLITSGTQKLRDQAPVMIIQKK